MKKNSCKENIKGLNCHSRRFLSGIYNACRFVTQRQTACVEDPQQRHLGMTANGFTLIELLVVVLIIGILAAIALPQYQKAVEKSRAVEAIQNAMLIEKCFNWYLLEHGWPSSGSVKLADMNCPIELNLGALDGSTYTSENFEYYSPSCKSYGCDVEISRSPSWDYTLVPTIFHPGSIERGCYTQKTDMGRYICNGLRNQGWEYYDLEF